MDESRNVRKFADPPWSNVDVSFKCKDMPLAEGPSKRDLGRKKNAERIYCSERRVRDHRPGKVQDGAITDPYHGVLQCIKKYW